MGRVWITQAMVTMVVRWLGRRVHADDKWQSSLSSSLSITSICSVQAEKRRGHVIMICHSKQTCLLLTAELMCQPITDCWEKLAGGISEATRDGTMLRDRFVVSALCRLSTRYSRPIYVPYSHCIMYTFIVLFIHWFNTLFPEYLRQSDLFF